MQAQHFIEGARVLQTNEASLRTGPAFNMPGVGCAAKQARLPANSRGETAFNQVTVVTIVDCQSA